MTIVNKDAEVVDLSIQTSLPCSSELKDETSCSGHLEEKGVMDRVLPRIRTEINAILGFTKFLDSEEAEQVEIIDDIRRSAQKLGSFLDLYRKGVFYDAGEYEKIEHCCSISVILKQIDVLKSPAAAKKGIQFKIIIDSSVPDTILCDPEWLQLSLENLVDNAIQYTVEGKVVVTVSMGSEETSDRVKIEIRDTGIGIRSEQLSHLFKPFWEIEEETFHNYGLGLPLIHRFAESVGGSIKVASALNKGTTFWLELPVGAGGQESRGHQGRISSMDTIRKLTAMNRSILHHQGVREDSLSDNA